MMEVASATIEDLHALLAADDHLTLPPRVYKRSIVQLVFSEAFTFRQIGRDATPNAIGGIAPLNDGVGEVWFFVTDASPGHALIGIVRNGRKILAERKGRYSGGYVCFVRHGNASGERLVRFLGFKPADFQIQGHQMWRWSDEQ